MYHYVEDREFLSRIRTEAVKLMQQLCHTLKADYDIGARPFMVGSGKRGLITQNANQPVDLDFNLEIVRCEDFDDCRYLKECVRKSFDKVLRAHGWWACQDSTSVLTAKRTRYPITDPANYAIDVCIVIQDEDGRYHRLIHKKTGWACYDEYYWNIAPYSRNLKAKEESIRKHGKWELVRDQYLRLKNLYLTRNDYDHPSFICYTEAVSNVYNTRNHW